MCYELQIHNTHTPLESLARDLPPERIVLFYPVRYDDFVKSLAALPGRHECQLPGRARARRADGQGGQASPCALPALLNAKLFIRGELCGGLTQNLKGRK